MRLQLARALMCPSDLLLLDEPTNHLDLDALVWLEAWLKRYAGTMIVISHDREFLDADHRRHAAHRRRQADPLRRQLQHASRTCAPSRWRCSRPPIAKQQEKIAHLQKFIDRFKAKASKAKQAQSRVKALERMEKLAPVLTEPTSASSSASRQSLPNPMLVDAGRQLRLPAADDAPAGTPPIVIVRNVNRSVLAGQRIGILGANGQGKSTLVKTIARDAARRSAATITEGKGLNIGYFAQQELDVLRPQDTPLEHMMRLAKDAIARPQHGRARAGSAQLPRQLQLQRRDGQAGRGHA